MLALNPVEGRPDNPDIAPGLRKCRKVKQLCRKCRECQVLCTQRDDQREPAKRIWPERQFPCRHCRGFAKPNPDIRQRLSAFGGVSQQGAEDGTPALGSAVEQGETTVSLAAKLAAVRILHRPPFIGNCPFSLSLSPLPPIKKEMVKDS